jgi:transposase
VDQDAVARDAATDGWFPLVTNSPDMTPAEVLGVYKRQPHIEKRFHQLKGGGPGASPVRLQKPERVGAMAACWHLALLVSALAEHAVHATMGRAGVDTLPLYPEHRPCAHPTARHIFAAAHRADPTGDLIAEALGEPRDTTLLLAA